MQQSGEIDALGREKFGADWDRYSDAAANLAAAHNLVQPGETSETIAQKLGSLIGTVKQQEANEAKSEQQARDDAWRADIAQRMTA